MAKVLVVEDQPSVISIVRHHLENAGHTALFTDEIEEGWRTILTEGPDACVMDIRLPGAEGWTLIEKVRNDPRVHDLPIVILTGLMEPDVLERAAALKCEYLSKPFAATALLNKLNSIIENRAQTRSTPGSLRPSLSNVDLVAADVVLLMDGYQIEGTLHLSPELTRFSDGWEAVIRDSRSFFPVTNARVRVRGEEDVIASPSFIEVRKADVRAIFPIESKPPKPPQ
jgi:CheY-like chemotaxis protein